MIYLNAFILGGFLCVLCQLLLMFTKLNPPKILILGFTVGAILTPFGIIEKLIGWGGAGIIIMVVDAGEAVVRATLAALSGVWLPVPLVLSIFVAVTLLGIIGGCIYIAIHKNATCEQEI